jgi:hypothetical protein
MGRRMEHILNVKKVAVMIINSVKVKDLFVFLEIAKDYIITHLRVTMK